MTLFPQSIGPIPEETRRVAWQANPHGTVMMRLRDRLGTLFEDADFQALYSQRGQPAQAPWQLILVTIMQYMHNLSDRQAVEAVRNRLDWKYMLGLSVSDAGFDASVLAEFRQRLLELEGGQFILDKLLEVCRTEGWIKEHGKMRSDSTHVLAAVRCLHHLETVGETLRVVLDELAEVAPDWLLSWVPLAWAERYGARLENARLPKTLEKRQQLALQIGQDGQRLLEALQQPEVPQEALHVESLTLLRQVWSQYYEEREGQLCWGDGPHQPAQQTIVSPHDPEARIAVKRDTTWLGYKVHLTETCEPDLPELVVQVKTTLAPRPDVSMTLPLQEELGQRGLLPGEHLVDGGYVDAEVLCRSQQQMHLVGPVPPDTSWQARAKKGYDVAHFEVQWEQQRVICPQGQQSRSWRERPERGGQIQVSFAPAVCQACPVRSDCTQGRRRELQLQPQAMAQALQQRRAAQETPEFWQAYALRSGVEATLSQASRVLPLRQSRYVGKDKTHLQELLTAVALNCWRLDAYWQGLPRGITRVSRFGRLLAQHQQPAGQVAA